ncbi:glycosyltransferase [Mycoplasma marinum]|uniref:Glycosyl transferase family 1 domain-containing protein n=1 Tax=Mycoplasma marinum TaxID=1937190 RepID=A0A4R0XLW4_9MOLU|nr:glycosyltransferase [Mycoplasma marinum]TCG11484.1 hypothetical protein C4B24_01870 [Mycoplasma marinum]
MKKIVILHYSLGGTGGLSKLSTTIANYWAEQGHKVTRIGLDEPYVKSPYKVSSKVKQMQLRKNMEVSTNKFTLKPSFIKGILTTLFPINIKIKERLNKELSKQDVIIVQNPMVLRWLNKKNKQKTTLYMHHQFGGGALMGKMIRFQARYIKKYIGRVVCLDPKTEKILNEKFKNIEFKFIPNFLNEKLGKINDKRDKITFMGRVAHIKNIDWIVEAAKEIDENIYIYGNIAPDYENIWNKMEKPKNLKYMGRTSESMKVLSETKIGLHTGKIEGYSLSMVESACSGNILVSADSWDSFDPQLKNIIHIASTKEEFIQSLKKALKQKNPSEKEIMKLREYFSFEKYIQNLESYIFI